MGTSRHLPITEKLRAVEQAIDTVTTLSKRVDKLIALERLLQLKDSVKNT